MIKYLLAAAIAIPVLGACAKEDKKADLEINTRMEEKEVAVPTINGEDTLKVKVPEVEVKKN